MPGGISFNLKYEQTFNQSIQIYGPYAYDATNTLIDAMIKANSYLPENISIFKNIQFKGVTGDISFDAKGDINRGSISMYQVKNSKWEYLKTWEIIKLILILMNFDIFFQQIINGLVIGSVYALVALGYTMVYGILGIINFAHGEVVMIGAMVALSIIFSCFNLISQFI